MVDIQLDMTSIKLAMQRLSLQNLMSAEKNKPLSVLLMPLLKVHITLARFKVKEHYSIRRDKPRV